MSAEKIEAVVIGAGVVGLACARALSAHGIETLIVERHDGIGQETSSRNSEVIHGGIYYAPGSLKARFCVQGNPALYAYCAQRGIAHQRCGKLIVATNPAQEGKLRQLLDQANSNGVGEIEMISGLQAMALEPQLWCTAALLSPATGIVDSHALMVALLGDAENQGATLALCSEVSKGEITADGIVLQITSGGEAMALTAQIVINAAGLDATTIASRIDGCPVEHVPRSYYAKGNYFSLACRAPFSRLVYPVPEPGGLGVHLTLDLGGQARFGPDVEWVDQIDYRVEPRRADGFYAEIRKYWNGLPDRALQPAYSGIRPKIAGPRDAGADFLIQGPSTHGVRGLVNLFGIESPGLTSCLPIADHVCALLGVGTPEKHAAS